MSRFVSLAVAGAIAGGGLAAPVPQTPAALVAGLSDPSAKVRDEAAAALQGRADALPWLRRAARSADADTARRAAALITTNEPRRQAAVARAIDVCIRDGRVDLFMEWHHYWQPESKDDLWPVGPRMVQAGQDEYVKWCPQHGETPFEPDKRFNLKPRSYDGPLERMPKESSSNKIWSIRTDQWRNPRSIEFVAFASVAGPMWLDRRAGGRFFVLGAVQARPPQQSVPFVVCDGDFDNGMVLAYRETQEWGETFNSFVACRSHFRGGGVLASVVLADGDVELFDRGGCEVRDSLIRAGGEIRLPKNAKVVNSTIQPHAKNATAPYKFFDLPDVGLSVIDDEEGLVVADVKPGTPFGNGGLAKGDVIQAIDDARPGHSSEFGRKVRRAMVRQGDCLLTVARGPKTLDLALYFPLPK